MSHYLAEKITAAESETEPREKVRLQEECSRLILEIWKHRAALPGRARPLESLTPILGAIRELRDNDHPWSRGTLRDDEAGEEPWLRFAKEMEDQALAIVRMSIFQAIVESCLPNEADRIAEHHEAFSKEEVWIVEELQQLLESSRSSFPIGVRDKLLDMSPEERMGKALEAADLRLRAMRRQLANLRKRLAKNATPDKDCG